MADIDIVPKQRSNTWMWVLLVLALVVLGFWLFNREPRRSTGVNGASAIHAMNNRTPVASTPLHRLAS